MTQHVRTSYRNHRRTTWGLAIALFVAIAAVLVPIAGGAGGGGKTYTLGLSPSDLQRPRPTGPSAPSSRSPTLHRDQKLGSAEIYFPANSIYSVTSPSGTSFRQVDAAYPGTWDIIGNLNDSGLGQRPVAQHHGYLEGGGTHR